MPNTSFLRLARLCAVIAGLVVALVGPAQAETIMVNTSSGSIYLVDVETRGVKRVASGPQFFDIALDTDATILGVTGRGVLWRLAVDGPARPIGQLGVFVNALGRDREGDLLAAGGSRLVTIGSRDGMVTPLGSYPGFNSSGDLALAGDGAIYLTGSSGPDSVDSLFRLSPDRESMERIGQTGFRNVYGLVWSDRLGTLIGVTEARELITVDAQTGKGRFLGMLDLDGWGYGAAILGSNAVISALSVR